MSAVDSAREGAALVAAYALLQDIARRHAAQVAVLAQAERGPQPEPQPDDEQPVERAA